MQKQKLSDIKDFLAHNEDCDDRRVEEQETLQPEPYGRHDQGWI